VRAAVGRPTDQPPETPANAEQVAAALRGLPSHGWTAGMFGRRDRALLVLSQLAGLPYKRIAALTAGDVTVHDGTTTITTPAGTATLLPAADDPVTCGPCAVTRWLRVLDRAGQAAPPVTDHSPHPCRSTRSEAEATRSAPLLPPIDQWGYLPFPLLGDLGAHRHLPVDPDADPEVAASATPAGHRN